MDERVIWKEKAAGFCDCSKVNIAKKGTKKRRLKKKKMPKNLSLGVALGKLKKK